ncbi:MAG: M16 family metallopeptidase [Acidobacteriota bacterium]
MKRISLALALVLLLAAPLSAQKVPVREYVLDNGLTLLMVPRKGDPNIAAGWIAKVGSVYERPGITGVAHLFEHMMFKGTHTIGTDNIDLDLKTIRELDETKAQLRAEEAKLLEAYRLGEIADPNDPAVRSPRHQQLLDKFNDLLAQQKAHLIKNEFDRIYTGQGASGMNAGTTNDFTIYFINVPANKLELWFWMESDRLANPVFREFYSERDVVHEERRLRTDSTPIGKFAEEFNALFWGSAPYSWPVVGWPSDLEGLTRDEALAFFDTYYAPSNLAAALVGDFDPDEAVALARKYFGRLHRGGKPPQRPRTREVPQMAEKRMVATAETNPQVVIRYHTVADGHVDEPALVVLGQLLSGRTGRLYKSLVEGKQIATVASGFQNGYQFEGFFQVNGVAKQGHTPEEVESGIYEELAELQSEPVGERELQKVKNQNAASNFRNLRSNFNLMFQLLIRESNRGWEQMNADPQLYDAVSAEDVMRVAATYFAPENRAVALYYRKQSGAEEDPLLAGLDDQEKQQVRQLRAMIGQANADQLRQMLQQFEQNAGQVPADNQDMLEVILKLIRDRLAEIGGER